MPLILLAEDESPTIDHVRSALSSQGWLVKTVGSRDQALRAASEFAPQLVLINESLSGAEDLVRTFSRRSGGPGVVLLLSGNGNGGSVAAESGHVDAVLQKPLETSALIETIRDRLAASKDKRPVLAAGEDNRLFTSEEIFGDFLGDILDRPQAPEPASGPTAAAPPAAPTPPPVAKPPTAPPPAAHGPEPAARPSEAAPPEAPAPAPRPAAPPTPPAAPAPRPQAPPQAATPEPAVPTQSPPPPAPAIPVAGLADLEEFVREEVEAFVDTVEPAPKTALELAWEQEEATAGLLDRLQRDLAAEAERSAEPESDASAPSRERRSLDDTLAGVLAASLSQVSQEEAEPSGTDDDAAQIDALLSRALGDLDFSAPPAAAVAPAPESAEEIELDFAAETLAAGVEREHEAEASEVDELFGPAEPEAVAPEVAAPREPEAPVAWTAEEPVAAPAPAPAPVPARPGTAFGEYTLEEKIGVGGMAEVWKARRQSLEGFEKRVAIKRILPQAAENEEFVEMFIDEAKLAAQLNHNNITHIYDLGKIDDAYFIAMEYVEGKNLRQILDRTRKQESTIPPGVALYIAARIAEALDYAHRSKDFDDAELGLVHRDVSPQNVLIGLAGEIKLCDFGIAKAVSKISTTQIGALKGKLQYMSPEQAWGKAIDHRSDIFSLGTLLFEMLSGERLFTGESDLAILEAVRKCDVATRIIQTPHIPAAVKGLLLKALAVEAEDRYDSAGELQRGLEALLRDEAETGPKELAAFVHELLGIQPEGATPYPAEDAEPAAAVEAAELAEEPGLELFESEPESAEEAPEEGAKKSWLRRLFTRILPVILVVAVGGGILVGLMQPDLFRPAPVQRMPVIEPAPAFDPERVTGGEPLALDSQPPPGEDQTSATPSPNPPPTTEPESPPPSPTEEAAGASVTPEASEPASAPAAAIDPDVERRVEQELQRVQELMASPGETPVEGPDSELAAGEPFAAEESPTEPFANEEPPTEPFANEESQGVESFEDEGLQALEPFAATAETAEASRVSDEEDLGFSTEEVQAPPQPLVAAEAEAEPVAAEPEPAPTPEPVEPTTRVGELVEPGPGVIAPRLLDFRQPDYTPMAQRLGVEGTVRVAVLVDEKGQVLDVELLEGLSQKVGLEEAVLRAARKATFTPATKDGIVVKMWHELSVRFEQ